MTDKNSTQPWALITGASSGLGVDFAHELAQQGTNLVLVARRTEPMAELAKELQTRHGVRTHVIAMDLAQAGAGTRLKQQLDQEKILIDTLINNAGFGVFGHFADQDLEKILGMLRLNVLGLTELTHVFATDMVQRRGGKILLVASLGGFQATPTYAAYSASKAYVLLLGEALHEELKPKGVTVTVLSPGITATSFLDVSGQKATFYQRLVMMRSRPVARIGLAALQRGRASIVPGLLNTLTAWSTKLMPRWVQRKVAHMLMRND